MTSTNGDEDYYDLIGVDPEATRDEIKEAYRARRREVDALGTPEAKAEAARLNRAWNVLSDPVQRERYDDEHYEYVDVDEDGHEIGSDGEVVEGGDASEPVAPAPPARRRLFEPAPRDTPPRGGKGQTSRRPPPPVREQIGEVAGVPLASNRERSIGLAIDFAIVALVLVTAVQFVAPAIARSQKPEVVDRIEALNDEWDARNDELDDAKQAVDDAEKQVDDAKESGSASDVREAEADLNDAEVAQDTAEKRLDDVEEERSDEIAKLGGIQTAVLGVGLFVAFLVMVVPTALTGRSPGKRVARTHLIGDDGRRASWGACAVHYGVPILVSGALLPLLGPIGAVLMLFGVTTFARSPRRQGWHDRLAHTYVARG
jgi:hypothetical protein